MYLQEFTAVPCTWYYLHGLSSSGSKPLAAVAVQSRSLQQSPGIYLPQSHPTTSNRSRLGGSSVVPSDAAIIDSVHFVSTKSHDDLGEILNLFANEHKTQKMK